jgi:hypothetical protein
MLPTNKNSEIECVSIVKLTNKVSCNFFSKKMIGVKLFDD